MLDIDELIRELECEKNDKESISAITIRQKDILIIISALKAAEARRIYNKVFSVKDYPSGQVKQAEDNYLKYVSGVFRE